MNDSIKNMLCQMTTAELQTKLEEIICKMTILTAEEEEIRDIILTLLAERNDD